MTRDNIILKPGQLHVAAAPANCDFKYVNCSVNHMVSELKGQGIASQEILAKVVGGPMS